MGNFVTPQQFSGSTDQQIQQWIAAVMNSGTPGYLPTGKYSCSQPVEFLLNQARTSGAKFYGDGVGRSILDMTDVAGDAPVLIHCTSFPGDNDYFSLKDIGIQANVAGTAVRIGNRDYSDPVNEPELDILVQNFSTSGAAVAVELNYVLNGQLRLVADVGGGGTGLLCRQAEFNDIRGSFSAIGGIGVYLTNGFNTGNVFTAPDIENVFCCLKIDNPNSAYNTFIGGTWSYTSSGVFATAGHDNRIINPQPNPVSPASVANYRGYMTGVVIESASV